MGPLDWHSIRTLGISLLTTALLTLTTHGRHFEYPEGQENPCILLDINFAVELRAMRGNEIVASAMGIDEEVDNVTGTCDDTNAQMNLIFINGTIWAQVFKKESNRDVIYDRYLQFVPSEVFNFNDTKTYYLAFPGTKTLPKAPFSYQCESPTNSDYTNNTVAPIDVKYVAKVVVYDIRVQAFNVENGTFGPAERCPQDVTTTSESTPATYPDTTVITSTEPPKQNKRYVVKNGSNVCISLEGTITIVIDYDTTSGERNTTSFQLPDNAESSGNCTLTSSSQNLDITFFEDWILKVVFSTDDADEKSLRAAACDKAYNISEVALNYITDDKGIPSFDLPPGFKPHFVSVHPDFPKTSAGTGYFKCTHGVIFILDQNVTVSLKDLKYKAFNQDGNANFTGSVDECSADEDSDDILPIVLGCTIAGAVLIILFLLVMIYRRRKRRGNYEVIDIGHE